MNHALNSIELTAPPGELIPLNYFAELSLHEIFGRIAPLEIDLGCGDGSFLAGLAGLNPERDFLGIERLRGRVRSASGKIARCGLTNARVLRAEVSYALQQMLPANSVDVFHLMFPDPWPKRRHWHRRAVTDNFLAAIYRALVPGGTLRIATDHAEYFQEMKRLIATSSYFTMTSKWNSLSGSSTFERRFDELGIEIYRLALRKVSEFRKPFNSQRSEKIVIVTAPVSS